MELQTGKPAVSGDIRRDIAELNRCLCVLMDEVNFYLGRLDSKFAGLDKRLADLEAAAEAQGTSETV